MFDIDFNRSILDLAKKPVMNSQGQRMTLASAAISLLETMPAADAVEANTAMALAQKIQQGQVSTTLMPPDMAVLKKAVKTNAAQLPAVALSAVAKAAGFTGSNAS